MKKKFNFNFKNPFHFDLKFNKKKFYTIYGILYLIIGFIIFYVTLPPLNPHSPLFWTYLTIMVVLIAIPILIVQTIPEGESDPTKKKLPLRRIAIAAIIICILTPVISGFAASEIFHAKEYASRIDVEMTDFSAINEVDFSKTPIIDRDTTEALGDRVMGEMTDLVSQFNVSSEYTQISYKDSVYRVTPLEYADFIKWVINRSDGVPAYITVDSTNGKTKLVNLSDLNLGNMKYVPSGYFNDNLMRHLRFKYPTKIFNEPSFELDESGHPWYVCTTYTYKGVGAKQSVTGAIFVDPISGDSTYYDLEDIPTWADRIYPESLIEEQINNYGSLQKGFINSIVGQKGVIQTSTGYNYIEKDGDIWLYTGITSVNNDASNLGFILVNLRTHEALRIKSPGADETSAQKSAEDEVKNYGYVATFPVLVSVNGQPTYLMSLRAGDESNSVLKMYAMVDATDYQLVATVSVDDGLNALKKKMTELQTTGEVSEDVLESKTITVNNLQRIDVDGTTKYYFKDGNGNSYKLDFSTKYEDILAFLENGDTITINYIESDGIQTVKSVEK